VKEVDMVLFLLVPAAFAHGPPAAVTGVAAADPEGPVHVTLTEGLGVRDDQGAWRYVCPASWGSTPIDPTAAGLGSEQVWLPGADALYVADAEGRVQTVGEAPTIASLLVLSRHDEAIVALTVGTDGERTVWDVAGGGVALWNSDEPFTGVAPWEGGIRLVGPLDGTLWSLTLDGDGRELAREDLGPADSSNPVLRPTPSTLYLVERSTGLEALTRLPDRQPIGPIVAEVLGPVEIGDRTWVALDGRLHAIEGDTVVPGPDDAVLSCLEAIDGAAWACTDGLLVPVAEDGGLGTPIVGPATIGAPDLDLVDRADVDLCFSQWRVWASDAGVDPGPAPEPPPVEDSDDDPLEVSDGGCGCRTPGGGGGWLTALVAWWSLRAGRSRKRAATTLTRWTAAGQGGAEV
jgi:hypothetical protein